MKNVTKYVKALKSYPKMFTKDKVYVVQRENDMWYYVIDDFGRNNAWGKQNFIEVKTFSK